MEDNTLVRCAKYDMCININCIHRVAHRDILDCREGICRIINDNVCCNILE